MTLIVGLENSDGKVYIGSDNGIFGGDDKWNAHEDKVFRKRNYLIGCAGSIRLGQIIRYHFDPPIFKSGNIYKFLVNRFVKNLVNCIHKYSPDIYSEVGAKDIDLEILLGYKGKIFTIGNDLGVYRDVANKFNVIGANGDVAKGVLFASEKLSKDLHPEQRIKLAFEGTAKFTTTVVPPYRIWKI